MVAFSTMEMAKVVLAAGRDDLALGAWVGETAVARAEEDRPAVPAPRRAVGRSVGTVMQDLMAMRAELMENRRVLRIAGGNLNDVARHANSTGEIAPQTGYVQDKVARAVADVDAAVARVDGIVRALAAELAVGA